MSKVYDNWARLVEATLRREQLREFGLKTWSDLSLASSSSFNFSSSSRQLSSFSFPEDGPTATADILAKAFTYQELAAATKNFGLENFLGECKSGSVYKGQLESGKVVAVKRLISLQRSEEFAAEVPKLSLLRHPNIVELIGYCADDDFRVLVYEFMPFGSLADHLHDLSPDKEPLDWNTRMKIAVGLAKGLEYLHNRANRPVIHRDLKPSDILLDEGCYPKLSGVGHAKHGPKGDETHVSTSFLRETYGYWNPPSVMTDYIMLKIDVYNFGVLLLELITGRKAFDPTRPRGETLLILWAKPLLDDQSKFEKMADPLLQGLYPKQGLHQALELITMSLQVQSDKRPSMRKVVTALTECYSDI